MYSFQKVLIFLLAIVYIQNKEPGQDTGAFYQLQILNLSNID